MTQSTLPPLAAELVVWGQLADRRYEESPKKPQQRLVLKLRLRGPTEGHSPSLRGCSLAEALTLSLAKSCATAMHPIDPILAKRPTPQLAHRPTLSLQTCLAITGQSDPAHCIHIWHWHTIRVKAKEFNLSITTSNKLHSLDFNLQVQHT